MIRLPLFVQWALANCLFGSGLAVVRLSYHQHIHEGGKLAIVVIFAAYALAAVLLGLSAWRIDRGQNPPARAKTDAEFVEGSVTGIAILGTLSGLSLVSQHDATGFAGLQGTFAATFAGVSCWLMLGLLLHIIARREVEHVVIIPR